MAMLLYTSLLDTIKDCLNIIPFLLLIFYIIEAVEYFYSDKMLAPVNFSRKLGPLLGVLLASIPQCGLSVIASTMYTKRFITRGTLIAVYLATSDEAIPVLLAGPNRLETILPLILIKIFTGLVAGYLIDLIFPPKMLKESFSSDEKIHVEKGCHSHSITKEGQSANLELFLHPLVHTLSVTFFIFLVTFLINVFVQYASAGAEGLLNFAVLKNRFVEPVVMAIIGLIPNCAVSVGITVLYIKGFIAFSSCVAGLCASGGLGILVLIKNNGSKKDTLGIILLLLTVSIITGLLLSVF